MRIRLLALALAAWLGQGCFVLEEIDKGQELMDAHSPVRNQQRREEAERRKSGRPAPAEEEEGGMLASLAGSVTETARSLWQSATTEAPPERDPNDVAVRCNVGGNIQYMLRSDCALRGGREG